MIDNNQIRHMVDRFLWWRLPENFNPDGGVSFKKFYNEHLTPPSKHEPTGTNLFDAGQAEAMVRHMVEGIPAQDFRWLIEAPGPRYLYVLNVPATHFEFRWTADHNAAMAFRDKKQANDVMMAVRQMVPELFSFERNLTDAKVVEHAWMTARI